MPEITAISSGGRCSCAIAFVNASNTE